MKFMTVVINFMTHKNIFMTETKFHVRHEISICVMKFMTAGIFFFSPKDFNFFFILSKIELFVHDRQHLVRDVCFG